MTATSDEAAGQRLEREDRAALDATTRRSLPIVFLGVGSFYVIAAVLLPLLVDPKPDGFVVARWAALGALGIGGALVLRLRPAPPGWGNPIAGLLLLLLVGSSLSVVATYGPMFLFAVVVAVLTSSLVLLSVPWVVALCAVAMAGWLALAQRAGGGPDWTPRTINLLAFCVLAIIVQAVRVGMHRRLGALVRRDAERVRQEHELAREHALAEQQRRILNRTAHELATPLTPIVLELELLDRSELEGEARQHLEVLQRNVKRLQEAIERAIRAAREMDRASGDHGTGPGPKVPPKS